MIESILLQADRPIGIALSGKTRPAHRILVVDDDIAILRLNAEALKRHGFEVDAAADGAAAWQALNNEEYDLLITDNRMPNVTGVELIKKVRSAHMALPVIMATGVWPGEEMTLYPWLQPVATLLKPYDIKQLLVTVREVLHATDSSREITAGQLDWQNKSDTAQRIPIQFL